MTTEQILLAGYAPMATVIGLLFKLLLAERQARLEFVQDKLKATDARQDKQQEMLQNILDVTKAQVSGALPTRRG